MINQTIRNLKFISEIGKGGMGIVYLAEHTVLARKFAVKCLPPKFTQDPEFRERFFHEARNHGMLQHPNIVQATDFFEEAGQFFLVMEYIDGQGLNRILDRRKRLPETKALTIIKDVLTGLNFAHQKGVIHRDIKPSNILVDAAGRAKILDFGIAIMMGGIRLTATGGNVGTAQYMSPEQIRRPKDIDHRTDVYSSGIVLYEMLTGEVPFDGETEDSDYDIREKQVREPPPDPRSKNPAISKTLSQIILKALEKNPDHRFAGCGEFLEYIEAYQRDVKTNVKTKEHQEQEKTVVEPAQKKKYLWEASLACILLMVMGVLILLYNINNPVPHSTATQPSTTISQVSSTTISQVSPKPFTNSIGQTFVYIKPGTFTMGSPKDEPGQNNDETQHQVTLTKGFYMQTTEVTQGQWKAVMGNNPSYFKNCGDKCPVESISWNDVQEFIQKLNQKEGTNSYRLPKEAEWEYAARAGSTTAFYNGAITNTACTPLDQNLDAIGWYCGNSCVTYTGGYFCSWCVNSCSAGTHPVAQKQPNAWGLYDMSGNVWEWCSDWYGAYPTDAVTDPAGPSTGSSRVLRGGSWFNYARHCRSAVRSGSSPSNGDYGIGFRLVRSLGQQ